MPVQSDKWIKKMAIDHKMIEPFEDNKSGATIYLTEYHPTVKMRG